MEPEESRHSYLTVKFMGADIKFGGKEVTLVVLALLMAAPVVAGLYLHDKRDSEDSLQLKTFMRAQIESTDATNYILTLSQTDREKLNLSKPKRIREMERN